MLNIVLYEPEIPYNTGNIGRTCVASGAGLHLIKPLGFQLTDKYIRRAGLDYWPRLHPTVHEDYTAFCRAAAGHRVWLATTKAHQLYTDVSFEPDDFIMFGPESRGIPEEILTAHEEDCIRIPMMAGERSLNLCNSAAIVLYEALRPGTPWRSPSPGLENGGFPVIQPWHQCQSRRHTVVRFLFHNQFAGEFSVHRSKHRFPLTDIVHADCLLDK